MSLPKGKWLALAVLLLAAGAVLAGLLFREGIIDEPVISRTAPAVAAAPKSMPQLESGWQQQRVLPALPHDMWGPRQQSSGRTDAMREAASAAPAPPQPPAMPYTYVGKGRDARGRFAVLGKDDRV